MFTPPSSPEAMQKGQGDVWADNPDLNTFTPLMNPGRWTPPGLFGKEVSPTVSGQLEGEAYAHAFRKIYTLARP